MNQIEELTYDEVKMFIGEMVTTPESSALQPIESFRSSHHKNGHCQPIVLVSGAWYYPHELERMAESLSGMPKLRGYKSALMEAKEMHNGAWHMFPPGGDTLFLGHLTDGEVKAVLVGLIRAYKLGYVAVQRSMQRALGLV